MNTRGSTAVGDVDRKPGYRTVTVYVRSELYDRVRNAAYGVLQEDIYQFVDEALVSALERRLTKPQRNAIEVMLTGTRHKLLTAKTG